MRYLLISCIILSTNSLSLAQSNGWQQKIAAIEKEFQQCMSSENKNTCQGYIGMAMQEVYKSSDLKDPASNEYLSFSEIKRLVKESDKWQMVGHAYDQEALKKAQSMANEGKPVVAVFTGDTDAETHVSLILPGDLAASGSWGMRVPDVTAFFTHNPSSSFSKKSMSYAYTKKMTLQIVLYAKK
ncbi:hypothetical protein [Fulvivirga lutea]|uniref:Peptidase C39-like domain-containing protein n=1 Tax=Fulvivirga lutea TaxID=2810512 RepID=A0A974WLL6_9BACT|nr:hypothetical protein [Fulvivirga lutea]QSE98480.1 hypothetical protein JR347_05215 [Fulvivirga lutea]